MTKGTKRIIIYLVLIFLVLVGLDIWVQHTKNNTVKILIFILSIGIMATFIIIIGVFIRKMNKEDNEVYHQFATYYEKNDYADAKKIAEERLVNAEYYISILKAKLLLILVELTQGNNEEARRIVETTLWRKFRINVYYYEILFAFYDKNLEKAEALYKEFLKKTQKYLKTFAPQYETVQKLFNYYHNGTKEDYHSIFPIVHELFKR